MMNNLINKAKKAPWVLGQPLTKKPSNPEAKISDLFIWRVSKDWNTYFELLDLSALFGDNNQHQAMIIFFDEKGKRFHQQSITLNGKQRQILNISNLLSKINRPLSGYGTFCIFHQQASQMVTDHQSFIAERGYISYQYKDAPLRSYVHGNLDAISQDSQDNQHDLMLLSGHSLFNRQYNLQYLLKPNNSYEMVFVNASNINKKMGFKVTDFDGKTHIHQQKNLTSQETFILEIKDLSAPSFLMIISRFIMARPVVFSFSNDKMDVFHG